MACRHAAAAILRLAALALRQTRHDEASTLVVTVPARTPGDAQAKSLLQHPCTVSRSASQVRFTHLGGGPF